MTAAIFFILGIFLAVLIHTVKHRLFQFTYFSGMAILRDFVWSILLGFIGALLLMKAVDSFLWNAKQTITKPFQKTYTFENDCDPDSIEPQYNTLTPGIPWSGVWYNPLLEDNYSISYTTNTFMYPRTSDAEQSIPEYYMTEMQEDGSTLIVYYHVDVPASDDAEVIVDARYLLSADQSTLTSLIDRNIISGEDPVYTRPDKSSANSLPSELWGYWSSDFRAPELYGENFEHFEQWYIIDAFRIDLFSGSTYDVSDFNTGFYGDRIEVKKTDVGTEYHISMKPTDTGMVLTYYTEDGQEKIDIRYEDSDAVMDTFVRLPEEKCQLIADEMKSRNASPRIARPAMIQDVIASGQRSGFYSFDSELEQAYQKALEQANESTETEAASIMDILAEPLPPLSDMSTDEASAEASPVEDSGENPDNEDAAATDITIEAPFSLLGLPGACTITVNGQTVPAALYIDGTSAIEQSSITQENTVIRYIYPDENGYRSGSAVVNPGDTETFFTGYAISDGTGKGQADSEELTMLMNAYYEKYLQAINEQDTSIMCFITDEYRDEIVSRVSSDANKKNYYDPAQFQIEISDGAIRYSGDLWENDAATLCFNMKVDFVKQDRETQQTESMSNYQTVLMRWDNGVWKVDNSDFITQDEYNGNVFAEFDN